jgi:hypothetical protein
LGVDTWRGATVNAEDFKGLRKLANSCGDDFKLGVVLYDGERTVPFGDRFLAAPTPCLWELIALARPRLRGGPV